MISNRPIWKIFNGILALILVFPSFNVRHVSAASTDCPTPPVRLTLASEQIEFCSPTSLPYTAVEDSASVPNVSYGGLDQRTGYGLLSIKAASPGYGPGPGKPAYKPGDLEAYRQVIREAETSQPDRLVSDGPSANLWGESVPAMQVEFVLQTSLGDLPLISIEWLVEHNDRLWSIAIAWDTTVENAAEWEAAAADFSIDAPAQTDLPDNALDLGAALQSSQSKPDFLQPAGIVTIPQPSWWNGSVCDDIHFYRDYRHSILLTTWMGLSVCDNNGNIDLGVYFPGGGWGVYEFECVELAMRLLYLQWGILPWHGNANEIAYEPTRPASTIFFPNDGTHPIVPGDIITEDASLNNSTGHVVVVIGVSIGAGGDGTITIIEQNTGSGGTRVMTVTDWIVNPDDWCFDQIVQGWIHVQANQADGDPDPAFIPVGGGLNGPVNAMGLQTSGKLVVAGPFTGYGASPVNHIARLNTNGSLDETFTIGNGISNTGGNAQAYALKVQSDDKVLVGGFFDKYNTTAVTNIARIGTTGAIDAAFTPPATMTATSGDAAINAIAVQSDGKILIAGKFHSLGGNTHDNIARLSSTGTLEATFTASTNGIIYSLLVQPDGKILIGGSFTQVYSSPRSGIARLNTDGTIDTSFNPGTGVNGSAVNSIVLQEDKILIAGNFSTYNGTSRSKIARLNANGSLETSFNPGTGIGGSSPYLLSVATQPDGRILIGGNFSTYNGVTLSNFIRLNYDGTRDTSFYARVDNTVRAILLQSDNKILLGGDFPSYATRLLNHIEPCYTLTTTASPPAGGSIVVNKAPNCPDNKYISGTVLSLTPVPNTADEYQFISWSGGASGSANPLNLTMTADKSITANFLNPPDFPYKSLPANGATNQLPNLNLSWTASGRATSYEYCLYITNPDDCEAAHGNWISTGAATSTSVTGLALSTTYHWQVRARNQVDTTDAIGGYWVFTVMNGIPPVPVTVLPAGFATLDPPPLFVWYPSPGATSYHLIIQPLPLPSTVVIDEVLDDSHCSAGGCVYRPSPPLPQGDYRFEVAAIGTGESEFSPWRTFTVVDGSVVHLPLVIR
jgi:uncharacterized delta-60 repeat protein